MTQVFIQGFNPWWLNGEQMRDLAQAVQMWVEREAEVAA